MGDKEESHQKRRKVQITLDNLYSSVLQRYTPSAVISVYQEVAQASCASKIIDWKDLVRRSSTGITNAREYQMLWRHLAYAHPLEERIEQGAEPLDDESDLEVDLEADPLGNAEDRADALASVQVLLASGPPSDLRTADAGSFPSEKLNGNASVNAHVAGNSGFHASSHKQFSQAYKSTDGMDANGNNSMSRKKRNPWTEEEDKELISAVNKCGEGNWANILRGDFNGERTASQLSQRWTILKKKNKYVGLGGSSVNGQQLSQAHLATRNALSVALKMPVTMTNSGTATSGTVSSSISAINPTETLHGTPVPEGLLQTSAQLGASSASLKNQLDAKKPPIPVKPSISSTAMLQAAAVAAGARIATPEDAESLLKAARAQAKNAVYIRNGGGIKSGTIGPLPSNHMGAPHFAGIGMPGTSISNSSVALPNVPKVGQTKPPATTAQSNAAPNMTSDKHSPVPKTEVTTIAKQPKVTDTVIPPPSNKDPGKLINESDVCGKPKECQQPNTSTSLAEETPHSSSLNSEIAAAPISKIKNPSTNEIINSIPSENVEGSSDKLASDSNVDT